MPRRETPPIGAPCWVDLMTSDTERSRAFYSQLLGWTAGDPAEELGGSIVVPAKDTPYGRLATATDPTGAEFKLVAPNAAMPARNPVDA